MIRINCPVCGLRNETEFTYGGDASVKRPLMNETSAQQWLDYVFNRDNPKGSHQEYWQCNSCRQWLMVERNTLTHKVCKCRLARNAVK